MTGNIPGLQPGPSGLQPGPGGSQPGPSGLRTGARGLQPGSSALHPGRRVSKKIKISRIRDLFMNSKLVLGMLLMQKSQFYAFKPVLVCSSYSI